MFIFSESLLEISIGKMKLQALTIINNAQVKFKIGIWVYLKKINFNYSMLCLSQEIFISLLNKVLKIFLSILEILYGLHLWYIGYLLELMYIMRFLFILCFLFILVTGSMLINFRFLFFHWKLLKILRNILIQKLGKFIEIKEDKIMINNNKVTLIFIKKDKIEFNKDFKNVNQEWTLNLLTMCH